MAGVARRLAEAEAALATLDEAVPLAAHSLLERDSAILRLIYTFEAMLKACHPRRARGHRSCIREQYNPHVSRQNRRRNRAASGRTAALLRRWLDAMREGGGG